VFGLVVLMNYLKTLELEHFVAKLNEVTSTWLWMLCLQQANIESGYVWIWRINYL